MLAESLLKWAAQHGRHDLPWQREPSPYSIWISEIMLQQTQVSTVIPYFVRFLKAFPSVSALARAQLDEVLHLWSGLGYYARAKRLHKTAQHLVKEHGGELPAHYDQLLLLPGIGRSTAGAILSFAYQKPYPILDGNVKRILYRYHKLAEIESPSKQTALLWKLVHHHLPEADPGRYNQALMDLGALVCKPKVPQCHLCPLQTSCAMEGPAEASHYPKASVRKLKPQYTKIFLVLCSVEDPIPIWLQPRTASDQIWEGLYAFPEFDSVDSAADWLAKMSNMQMPSNPFKVERHQFTHLNWFIHYYHVRLHARARTQFDQKSLPLRGIWYTQTQTTPTIGMPTPIRKVIAEILPSAAFSR